MAKHDQWFILVEAINRQTVLLEELPESIGKSIAKWLIKADLPTQKGELQVAAYLELGFQPVEVVDLLYPNLSKTDRRAKAKAISERFKK